MRRCPYDGCAWTPVAPTRTGRDRKVAEHIVDAHSRDVDVDVPEGKTLVSKDGGETWQAVDHPGDVAHDHS